jgi:hypothetical protein
VAEGRCALSLRLALFAAGDGEVRLRNFTYQSLER